MRHKTAQKTNKKYDLVWIVIQGNMAWNLEKFLSKSPAGPQQDLDLRHTREYHVPNNPADEQSSTVGIYFT